jgi:hypothetical protein
MSGRKLATVLSGAFVTLLLGLYVFTDAEDKKKKNSREVPVPLTDAEVEAGRQRLEVLLKNSPDVGFYKPRPGADESKLDDDDRKKIWSSFVQFCINFIRTEALPIEDPRLAEIRNDMKAHISELSEPLSWIKCRVDDNLCRISHKFADMEKPALLKTYDGTLSKIEDTKNLMKSMADPTSAKYQEIAQGLTAKYDEEIVRSKLAQIAAGKEKALAELQTKAENSLAALQGDASFHRYSHFCSVLGPYLDRYKTLSSETGTIAQTYGSAFEKKSRRVFPLILEKLKLSGRNGFNWYRGVAWENVPGEIDWVLVDTELWVVIALVECKANPFDVSAAYIQSGSGYRDASKRRICIPIVSSSNEDKKSRPCHVLEVPTDCPCFVITTTDYPRGERVRFPVENKVRTRIENFVLVYHGREDMEDYDSDEKAMRIEKLEWITNAVQADISKQLSPVDFLREFREYVFVI